MHKYNISIQIKNPENYPRVLSYSARHGSLPDLCDQAKVGFNPALPNPPTAYPSEKRAIRLQ